MSKRGQALSVICGMAALGLVMPPATRAASFDGTYTGKRTLTKGDHPSCPKEDDVSATIKGRTLTFSDSDLKSYTIGFGVQSDGSFDLIHTEIGGRDVTIRGRIVGNAIDADVTNGPCQYHWHVEKP